MAEAVTTGRDPLRVTRFALTKFRPPALPDTLMTRSALHERLAAGSGQRLTVVVGSAGAGKTVLLAGWAAARPPGVTSWLSCDRADADPVRFWAGFIEAPRAIEPGFGADAADLLAMDRMMSADVSASVANDAARLPAGSAIIVDDFHYAAAAVARDMTDLVERWPAETVQLVLAARSDPPLRQHRLRMSGQLCEIRDRALYMSLAESRDLLGNFGVQISDNDLALLHERTEGWPAALQMAALSLRGTRDPAQVAQALEVRSPTIAESVKLVMVPGARALAWFESGHLAQAADAARAADAQAKRLGFGQHFFAVDHLRVLSGLALERRDLDTAEHLTERVLSITEQRRPLFEFLALLDRAQIWAARGQVRDALTTIGAARQVVPGASPVLLALADEQEALLRLSLGDLRSAADLVGGHLPAVRRSLLLARIALAADDRHAVQEHLQTAALYDLTPRYELVRQVLLVAAAIQRGDPAAASILGGAPHTARSQGFINTFLTAAPQVASYLVEHAAQLRADPFTGQLVAAALDVRGTQPRTAPASRILAEPLTAAEQRVLALLPTSTYLQIADTLYVSRNTVKDPSPVDLPETRGGVTLGGSQAGPRVAPALNLPRAPSAGSVATTRVPHPADREGHRWQLPRSSLHVFAAGMAAYGKHVRLRHGQQLNPAGHRTRRRTGDVDGQTR